MKQLLIFGIAMMCWWAAPANAQTATPTPTPTATATATSTATATATATSTVTATPTATATPFIINDTGAAGAPVAVSACSGGSTEVIRGSRSNTTWTVMCEADARCELGDSADDAPIITPTATVGFLFKANQYINEASISVGSAIVTLRMDCCGVAGATSCDSWRE